MRPKALPHVQSFFPIGHNDYEVKGEGDFLEGVYRECDELALDLEMLVYVIDANNVFYPPMADEFKDFEDLTYTCRYFNVPFHNIKQASPSKALRLAENVNQMKARAFLLKYHKLNKNKNTLRHIVRFLKISSETAEVAKIKRLDRRTRLPFKKHLMRKRHPREF